MITRIFLASVGHKHATNFMHLATTDTWNQQGATFFLLSSMNIIHIYYVICSEISSASSSEPAEDLFDRNIPQRYNLSKSQSE